ncbi:MAG: hypothetical protein M3R72_02275 [Bacteroidota bacterium]|nr:hypothetical protein [Bacteroidota bacterium]
MKGLHRIVLVMMGAFVFASSFAQDNIALKESQLMYSNQVYRNDSIAHTTWKPVLLTDSIVQPSQHSWLRRKFFEEHLLSVQQPGFNLYGDIIEDEHIGYDTRAVSPPNPSPQVYHIPELNTRGYEVHGNIGNQFYFETNFYENQGRFPGYLDSLVRITQAIPRTANYKNALGDGPGFDFNYSSARLVYTPNKHLLFDLGYNQNFIGDGYRSLFLSDWSINYPYFRTAITFGKLQYSVMWSEYITATKTASQLANSPYYAFGFSHKWAQTYLLDYAVTKKFSAGLFESVVWSGGNINLNSEIDATYASPIIFAHSGKSKSGIDNNELLGLNLKYHFLPKANVYSQLALDKTGSDAANRYGVQAGVRVWDFLKIANWNAVLEFNTVRPYTYSSSDLHAVYGHANLPLAHPLGANFREVVGVTDFTYKKWWFRAEAFIAQQGLDSANGAVNFGSNIFNGSTAYPSGNISTMQGVKTNIYYGELRIAYVLNPKTNLRLETGFTYRRESNSVRVFEDKYAYIGVRMSFRNLVYDF